MSRKQRRPAGPPSGLRVPLPAQTGSPPWGLDRLLEGALKLHAAGRLGEAENAYRTILASDPEHVQSLHHLGVIAAQVGRHDIAIDLIGKSLALNDRSHEAHHNIGLAHHLQGHHDAALAHFLRAIKLKPSYVDAHVSLANLHKKQGETDKAVAHYRRALGLQANHAEANYNFGVMLEAQGKWDEAAIRYRRALAVKPGHAQAHLNLGNVLLRRNEPAEAIACYRRSLELKPDDALALRNLATALHAQGEIGPALDAVAHALLIEETDEAKDLFVRCARTFPPTANFGHLRSVTIRAFADCWTDPAVLAALTIRLINHTSGTTECIARAKAAWPDRLTADDLFGASGRAIVCGDELLRTLLESTQVPDVGMERFLTVVRSVMLDLAASASHSTDVDEDVLAFHCSLARQCFINEYVFDLAADELDKAQQLRQSLMAALASGAPVAPAWLAAVATYFPLHSLPASEALLDRSWPDAVSALLDLQVREPLEERDIAPTIRRLTAIDDDVSLLVQRQYEQNPYPRWIKLPPPPQPVAPDAWLRQSFGTVSLPELAGRSSFEMLIAGCGTGRHSIQAVRQLAQTQALAVDLSLTSLCYAKRRTRALGISTIEYAQADILKLGSIGKTFDIIESVGVLHHLADPMAGWRVLLSLLRPGGLMFLGFYSELARRDVVAARALIAERGYGRDADGIRRCRQDLLASGDTFRSLTQFTDFFSVSDCRDLLFHVQEHRLTLRQISTFLVDNNLKLIGFQVDAEVRKKFQLRFPGNEAVTDLEAWHVFETENPDTFAGMYQFWVQKSGEA